MHCWCPPATGPGQPHRDDCSHYRRPILHAAVGSYHDWDLTEADAKMVPAPVDFIAEAQAYNHALQWLAFAHATAPIAHSIDCTCAAKYGVIGHAASCPLGEKAESDAAAL